MIKEFKEFIVQGNALDLAIGVVIGGAFSSIVSALVEGFITPLVEFAIALITGSKTGEISGLSVTLRKGIVLDFNMIVSAIITFFITMFVVFLIVKAMNKARSLGKKQEEEEEVAEELAAAEVYLREIRDLLANDPEAINKIKQDNQL